MNTQKDLGTIEDRMISLNGQTASRERAESRLKHLSDKRASGLTADEAAELEAITAELQKLAGEKCDGMIKSLNGSVSNFLRSRKRRGPEVMAKSLRNGQRLVLPR